MYKALDQYRILPLPLPIRAAVGFFVTAKFKLDLTQILVSFLSSLFRKALEANSSKFEILALSSDIIDKLPLKVVS